MLSSLTKRSGCWNWGRLTSRYPIRLMGSSMTRSGGPRFRLASFHRRLTALVPLSHYPTLQPCHNFLSRHPTSRPTARSTSLRRPHPLRRFNPSCPCEPGCSRSFKDERTRKRHRNKSCKLVPRDNCGSTCRCGKYFSRFDGITKHQKHCDSPLGAAYECVDCDEAFADMGSLTEHHRANHVEKAGRPKLRRNREHCG